jgi:hypothetical protein
MFNWKAFLFSGFLVIAAMTYAMGVPYLVDRINTAHDCQRFTRELKILQACESAKSCIYSPSDLRRMDSLQTNCQELGK